MPNQPLSQRLEALAVSVECDTFTHDEVALIREAAAIAKAVENAPTGICRERGGSLAFITIGMLPPDSAVPALDQHVAIIPIDNPTKWED